ALSHVESDAAQTENGDCGAIANVRGVDRRAHAGRDRTADGAGEVEGHVVANGGDITLVHHDELCQRTDPRIGKDRRAIQGEPALWSRDLGKEYLAQIGPVRQ